MTEADVMGQVRAAGPHPSVPHREGTAEMQVQKPPQGGRGNREPEGKEGALRGAGRGDAGGKHQKPQELSAADARQCQMRQTSSREEG